MCLQAAAVAGLTALPAVVKPCALPRSVCVVLARPVPMPSGLILPSAVVVASHEEVHQRAQKEDAVTKNSGITRFDRPEYNQRRQDDEGGRPSRPTPASPIDLIHGLSVPALLAAGKPRRSVNSIARNVPLLEASIRRTI